MTFGSVMEQSCLSTHPTPLGWCGTKCRFEAGDSLPDGTDTTPAFRELLAVGQALTPGSSGLMGGAEFLFAGAPRAQKSHRPCLR